MLSKVKVELNYFKLTILYIELNTYIGGIFVIMFEATAGDHQFLFQL